MVRLYMYRWIHQDSMLKKDLSRFLGLLISRIYIFFIFQNKTWQQGFTLPIEDLRIKHLTVENKIK